MPPSPWNKKFNRNVIPSPPLPSAIAGGQTAYDETQDEEIEVLKSIYMENFEEVESKVAWSKSSDRSFKLRLDASRAELFVELNVTLTATYPKTVPLLTLGNTSTLRAKPLEKIHNIIATKPKELLGEVMIHEIATSIQDVLEDAIEARNQDDMLPSLEEERAMRETAASALAKRQEADELERLQNEKAEEDRVLQQMLDDEIKRRENKRKQRLRNNDNIPDAVQATSMSKLELDQTITFQNESFRTVSINTKMSSGIISDVFVASPISNSVSSLSLALKRVVVPGGQSRSKKQILEIEDELEKLKALPHHANIIDMLDFKIDIDKERWKFDILMEFANKGSLKDLLDICYVLPASKARSGAVEILDGLDFYRKHGVIHGRINVNNVLLFHQKSGALTYKLGDASVQSALYDLKIGRDSVHRPFPWSAPELDSGTGQRSHKSDVWDFAVVLIQMLFGLDITERYSSPTTLHDMMNLSEPLLEILGDLFASDPRKRPNAFSIATCEFLRTDCPAISQDLLAMSRPASSTMQVSRRMLRRESSNAVPTMSRYDTDWVEAARLGRGAGGEVVKARNRMDSRFYAIKKIKHKSPTELSQILSEVRLLANLNHPYVVRYYQAWKEDEDDFSNLEKSSQSQIYDEEFSAAETTGISFGYGHSTGLDLYSGPRITFGEDSDESEDDGTDDQPGPLSSEDIGSPKHSQTDSLKDQAEGLNLVHTRSASRTVIKSTLYIQMEFAEKKTLRDIIHKGINDQGDGLWSLFRQILEGLVHIHSHGIIHRDLKPENIFIDAANQPRIGDFGLATSGQFDVVEQKKHSANNRHETYTGNIGTALYVAPEVRVSIGGQYTDKVDMYSLGVIFFEMCHPLGTGMERIRVLTHIREKQHSLPTELHSSEKAMQRDIIESLISHRPSERPSSIELLRSGKVPAQVEDGAIRLALQALTDSSSPYYHKMMTALFMESPNQLITDHMWDHGRANDHATSIEYRIFQEAVQDSLVAIFRHHGAVESQRPSIFPRSDHYRNNNAVKLLDASGNHVQLPFDLTFPYSRILSRQGSQGEKTFAFGTVYRDLLTAGAPGSNREADFDIVSDDTDLTLKEAEVIKVLDEVLDAIPSVATANVVFHISHSALLDNILDFARISAPQRPSVIEILSKLGIQQWTWQKIRSEIRGSPALGVSSTSLDDLARFDFREPPEKCLTKLQSLFLSSSNHLSRLEAVFVQILQVFSYLKKLGVSRPVYVSPLSNFNEHFYKNGIMFQCLFDTKRRDVLAAGGRYDSLLEEQRSKLPEQYPRGKLHAVGFNLGWDRLVASLIRYKKRAGGNSNFLKKNDELELRGKWAARRCEVLIASFDRVLLRAIGPSMLAELWANDISAELSIDCQSPEELLAHYRDDRHSWIVIIKHEASTIAKPDLRVKSMDRERREDADIRSAELISFLKAEMRERDQRDGVMATERTKYPRQHGNMPAKAAMPPTEKNDNVHVLVSSHKSKKSNKWRVVEAAHLRSREILDSFSDAPIASIETRDEVLDMIRETKLSDPDTWRTLIQAVPVSEREYAQDILNLINKLKVQYGENNRHCFVHNYRTGYCILYDMFL